MDAGTAQKLSQQLQASQDDASIVEKRLSTEDLKQNIRYFLAGYKTITKRNDDGELVRQKVQDEDLRKLNEEGIHAIMTLVNTTFDSSMVQGNTSEEQYNEIVGDWHETIYDHLWVQAPRYGLTEEDFDLVVEELTSAARLFLSRTIGDGERKAMSNSMTVQESHQVNNNSQSQGLISRFFGG